MRPARWMQSSARAEGKAAMVNKRWRASRILAADVVSGDYLRWRGVIQRVLSIEAGDGMPWPVGVQWRAFHLAPPDGNLEFGYAPTIVVTVKTRITKAEVIPCGLCVTKKT